MHLHKKNPSIFFPLCSHLQQSLRIHPGASWRMVQFLRWRVRVKARVKAFGLPKVPHHSSAILGRGKFKSILKTLIFLQPVNPKPLTLPVSCCSEHLSNSFPNYLLLKTLQLVVSSCCPGTPVMCAGERCCLSQHCQTHNTWSTSSRPNPGLFSTSVLRVTLPDPVLSHLSRRNTYFRKDFHFGQDWLKIVQIQAVVGELPASPSCKAPTWGSRSWKSCLVMWHWRRVTGKGHPVPGSVSTAALGDSNQLPGPAKAFAGHLGPSAATCQLPPGHQHLSGAAHVAKQLPGLPHLHSHTPSCRDTSRETLLAVTTGSASEEKPLSKSSTELKLL